MSQKSDTLPLILSLLITLALLGAGVWWFTSRFNSNLLPSASTVPRGGSAPTSGTIPLQDRLSTGSKLLTPGQVSPDQQAGIAALATRDYNTAVSRFEAALKDRRNDPETLIYFNNARIGDQNSYTIAVTIPMGTDVNGSLEILRGVAQAQDEMNRAGGISGKFLKVAIANDDNDPAIAKQIATALAEDPTVLGVVGNYASDVTLAAAEVYEAKGLVTISPVSSSVKLSGFGKYIFRTVPSDFIAARSLGDYMLKQLQQQKAAVFYNSQSGYSQSLRSEFGSALSLGGGQVVSEVDLSSPTFSVSESLKRAQQEGATVLAFLVNTSQLDKALQLIQTSSGQFKLLGGDDVYTPKVLEVAGAKAEGMVIAVPWHILSNPQSEFVKNSRQIWGGDVNWRTATAYDATQALIAALKQNPTRQGVEQTLRSDQFSAPGATGTVRFLPSGDRNQAVQLVTVQAGSRSGYGYDFVPIP